MIGWTLVMRYGGREIADEWMAKLIDKDLEKEKNEVTLDLNGIVAITPKFREWVEKGVADRRFRVTGVEHVGAIVKWETK